MLLWPAAATHLKKGTFAGVSVVQNLNVACSYPELTYTRARGKARTQHQDASVTLRRSTQ